MDKNNKGQAEKLQAKLDRLLQTREKKQKAFEKSKEELNTVSKEVENVKLKLFIILQNGSNDVIFSNWAKRKINENSNPANTEKPAVQNHQLYIRQNHYERQPPE